MGISKDLLITGTGCRSDIADQWLGPINDAMDKFAISASNEGIAAFLANVGVESNGFLSEVENMNYSATRLAQVWPFRFAADPHQSTKVPNTLAISIGGNPKAVANNVYANRLGNGDVASGDGWKYRGVGPIQLTGKSNIQGFFAAAGMPLDTDPNTLTEPENGALSAAYFFAKSGALDAVNRGLGFSASVKCVNGSLPCAANQGDLRTSRYNTVMAAFAQAQKSAPTKTATKQSQKSSDD